MIIDCREWHKLPAAEVAKQRRRIYVDGVEILQVWYVDTDAGIVKSYDVGEGRAFAAADKPVMGKTPSELLAEGFEDEGGVWSRTLTGRVELRLPPEFEHGVSTV